MDNLHAQISEILAEGMRRQKAREKAVAKNRARAGEIGAAYSDRMTKIEKAALGLADDAMHGERRKDK